MGRVRARQRSDVLLHAAVAQAKALEFLSVGAFEAISKMAARI